LLDVMVSLVHEPVLFDPVFVGFFCPKKFVCKRSNNLKY